MLYDKEVKTLFEQGFDCGQVTFSYAAEKLGFDKDTANKIAAGFGAGMFKGDTCGAVTGAIMAIGLKYGNYRPDMTNEKKETFFKVKEFETKFYEIFNTTICRELLNDDISTPKGKASIMEKGLLFKVCPKLVAASTEILDDML